jgi:hypothetical protein
MRNPTPDDIKRALCELTFVEMDAYGYEIVLPQVYSNGETVVVTASPEGDTFFVHDGGHAGMALEAAGVAVSPRLQEELSRGVAAYGCRISQFRVYKQCSGDGIAEAAAVVGCASRFVADFAFQAEARPMFDFKRQVVETLFETVGAARVRENEEVIAKSGSHYHVSAIILDPRGSKPQAYVEAVSNHQAVARKFRALYDMMNTPGIAETPRFAVFDDSRNGITVSDLSLLKDVSRTVGLRERNTLSQIAETLQ